MSGWSSGLKIALSVLGVVLFATAVMTFVNWKPASKFGMGVFTVGAALVAGVIGSKFLPKGATAGLLAAGLALGGYQMVGDKVEEFGRNIGESIRGKGSPAGMPSTPASKPTSPGSYDQTGSFSYTPPAPPPSAPAPAPAPAPVPQAPKVDPWVSILGEVIKGGASIAGSYVSTLGSKGVDDFAGSLGADSRELEEMAESMM